MNIPFMICVWTLLVLGLGFGIGVYIERDNWNKLVRRGAIIPPKRISRRGIMEILK